MKAKPGAKDGVVATEAKVEPEKKMEKKVEKKVEKKPEGKEQKTVPPMKGVKGAKDSEGKAEVMQNMPFDEAVDVDASESVESEKDGETANPQPPAVQVEAQKKPAG